MPGKSTFVLSPPIMGINTTAPIDAFPEGYCLDMVNVYPENGILKARNGIAEHDQLSTTSPLKSLYNITLADGTEKMVTATDTDLYEVDAASIKGTTTPTNGEWQGVVFNHNLFLANGADTVQVWTGSGNFADSTYLGVTLADLVNVSTYKERIYFVEKQSGSIWYSGLKLISGTLTEYDISYFLKLGGYIVACGSWTNQLAQTSSDLFWILSSEGEILFYQGADPGASDWVIVARYKIGKPLGYRCAIDVENDTVLLTDAGLVPISALFQGGFVAASNGLSREVNKLIRGASALNAFSYLWSGVYWARGARLYLQCPVGTSETKLLVCNLETGAWTKYEIINDPDITTNATNQPLQMAINNGKPFAASYSGVVHEYEKGKSDNAKPIQLRVQYPFSYYGSRSQVKKFLDVRALLYTAKGVKLNYGMAIDYRRVNSLGSLETNAQGGTPWGSPWDSPWGSSLEFFQERGALKGIGHAGALRIESSITDTPLEINTIEVGIELGGRL